jgi:1-phosphofructokinase
MILGYMPEPIFTLTLNPAIDRTVRITDFKVGAVNRVEQANDRAGGKGINVAATLAGLGHAVTALGFLGRDNAEVFTTFFARLGIEDRCLRLPGATRVGIKIFDPLLGETTDINFPGLPPAGADLATLRAQLACLGDSGSWCVLAGSLPPGVAPELYAEFIRMLKARGVRAVVDTSGEALRAALRGAPDIIKPNQHELEVLVGCSLPTEAAVIGSARELVAGGVRLVVVSRGAAGACFVTADEVVVARPPAVKVGSTVGAGDAMVAGVVAAQLRGASLAETARHATACSLAVLTAAAGSRELLGADQVAAFEPQIDVRLV